MSPIREANPFVGPRSFDEAEGDRFFGRDRELGKLLNLLIARRLVLLHAPSGAGKTSLINAALVPKLREEGFVVRPTVRLSAPVPAEAAELRPNRFTLATLLALEEARPEHQRAAPAELARLTLAAYLDRLPAEGVGDEVLIFDQFEELLTVDPADRPAKEAFLSALGAALESPRRWALFSIREDYLGSLRPLLVRLPTRLEALFRLELLDPQQAKRAIQDPARLEGVTITDAAATALVDDLRRATVQQHDGASAVVLGQAIEPVQLQVVCYRLWGRTTDPMITPADIEQVGDVDEALRAYYAEQVARAEAVTRVSERLIRDWIERQLITGAYLRGQVLREPAQTAGLPNAAIGKLVDAHLVRGEERRGATWYELAHDRLVEPIRASNQAWREANLTPIQRQAALWESQSRPDGLLLRGEALRAAERSIAPESLLEMERAFLERSRAEARKAWRARLLTGLVILGFIATSILLLITSRLLTETSEQRDLAATSQARAESQAAAAQTAEGLAQEQLQIAEVRRLAGLALSSSDRFAERRVLLALEALRTARQAPAVAAAAGTALRETMGAIDGEAVVTLDQDSVAALQFSPDGAYLAGHTLGDGFLLWSVRDGQLQPLALDVMHSVSAFAFSPDSRSLALGGSRELSVWSLGQEPRLITTFALPEETADDMRLIVWSSEAERIVGLDWANQLHRIELAGGRQSTVRLKDDDTEFADAAISPSGRHLATSDDASSYSVWDIAAPDPVNLGTSRMINTESEITVTFSPDGTLLAITANPGGIALSDLSGEAPQFIDSVRLQQRISAVTFAPDGKTLITASTDGLISFRSTDSLQEETRQLQTSTTFLGSLAVSDDGGYLFGSGRVKYNFTGTRYSVRSSDIQTIDIWDLAQPRGEPVAVLRGHEGNVYGLAVHPGADLLVSADEAGVVRAWNPRAPRVEPFQIPRWTNLYDTVWTPDSGSVLTGGADGRILAWDFGAFRQRKFVSPEGDVAHVSGVRRLAVSADGRLLASGGVSDGKVKLWDVATGSLLEVVSAEEGAPVVDLAFSPDSRWLAASTDNELLLWDTATYRRRRLFAEDWNTHYSLAFASDSSRLIAGAFEARLVIASLNEDEVNTQVLSEHVPFSSVVYDSTRDQVLFIGDRSDQVVTLDVLQEGYPTTTLRVPNTQLDTLALSDDGAWLAASNRNEQAIMLWQLGDPQPGPTVLRGHQASIDQLVFNVAQGQLISKDWSAEMRVWDLSDLRREPQIIRHPEDTRLKTLSVSPDGGRLIVRAQSSTSVHLLAADSLVEAACRLLSRNLTWEEWQIYVGEAPYDRTCPQLPVNGTLVEAGKQLARSGRAQEALALLERAVELSPELGLDPAALVKDGLTEALQEEFSRAEEDQDFGPVIAFIEQHTAFDLLDGIAPWLLANACYQGAIQQQAGEVLVLCDGAVEAEPDYGPYYDRRGVARALSGDYPGAIADFEAYNEWGLRPENTTQVLQRRTWIRELEAGSNPFDQKTLESWQPE